MQSKSIILYFYTLYFFLESFRYIIPQTKLDLTESESYLVMANPHRCYK